MPKTSLIFDFDLTLADASPGIIKCVNYALKNMLHKIPDEITIKKTIGHSLPDTYKLLTGNKEEENAKLFTKLFVENADRVMNENTRVFPEVFELLPDIKKTGYKTAIVSTKYRYRIEGILQRDKLSGYFDHIIGGEDVKTHKPDPEGILLAINKLNENKQNILYIGDSLIDLYTAKAAELDFVAILTGTITKEQFHAEKCHHILPDLSQLKKYITQNFK